VGFKQDPNKEPLVTFQEAIAEINALAPPPDFVIHTGDMTHLAKAEEFDAAAELLKTIKVKEIFYVPGEHDELDSGQEYLKRYGKGTIGTGWHSHDHKGVHFIGLVNVAKLTSTGLGSLGPEQLDWLRKDVERLDPSTPIIVYTHMPLWMLYPQWGWGTEDGDQALSLMKRFKSVSVLQGHIHQIQSKIDGNLTLHTARSTAFPIVEAGKGPGPVPDKNVPPDKLRSMIGLTRVNYRGQKHSVGIFDSSLADKQL
jgi:3',5'-cyclic AMP phosphodiesterase CpdA